MDDCRSIGGLFENTTGLKEINIRGWSLDPTKITTDKALSSLVNLERIIVDNGTSLTTDPSFIAQIPKHNNGAWIAQSVTEDADNPKLDSGSNRVFEGMAVLNTSPTTSTNKSLENLYAYTNGGNDHGIVTWEFGYGTFINFEPNRNDAEGYIPSAFLKGGEEASRTGKPSVYYCSNGLMDFAAPVIVNGKHIGSLIGGQVLPEAPDEAKFRKIADELGIDQDEYIAALKKVKIVPKRQIEAAANLLWQMANSLSEVGYERLVAIESQKNKENTVKAVDQKFGEIDSRMGDVVANIQDLENVFGAIKESAASSTKAVESTDGIVKAIENASTQLTLIGFNASIEAKRAGAAGAGFNVIAQEVRTLADKNTKQANEVENTLNEIKKAITGINAQLKNCNSEIQKNVEVLESLKTLVDEASVQVKNLK